MNQTEVNAIVEMVTRQVMAALGDAPQQSGKQDGLSKILVIGGSGQELPDELKQDAVLFDMEDYKRNQNILHYHQVAIVHLTITQMVDIAQGRIGDEVSCAVVHALLNGVSTSMLETALPHRRYAGKGSTPLYALLENYAQTLQVFGVKLLKKQIRAEAPAVKPPRYAAPPAVPPKGSASPNGSRLITETDALEMVKSGGSVCLPRGAILTPSARDVFTRAGIELA